MTTLRDALQGTAWHRLRAIGRRRGVSIPSDLPKADLVDRLTSTLPDPANLNATLAGLDEAERRALADLQTAGGRLPLRYLRPRHGGLPPLGGGPLEQLLALGLVFHDRAAGDLFIPTDIIPLLPPLAQPTPPAIAPAVGADEPAFIAAHDLACLLALLQGGDVRPIHGRWLPPRLLVAWGERCAALPAAPQARSEMQAGRRRFLHYLAEAAGLIGLAGPYLTPTPAAWAWLNAAPADRLNALWQTFLASDSALWRIYRLPGHDLTPHPDKLIAAVIQALPGHDPADPAAFAEALLARQPSLRDLLPSNLLDADADLAAAITDLLTGPLVWLGVLAEQGSKGDREQGGKGVEEKGSRGDRPSAPPLPPGPSARTGCSSAPLLPCASTPLLRLTAWGAHWLGLSPTPEIPPPPRFALTSDIPNNVLTFTLPVGLPDPAHLMCLEACAEEQGSCGAEEQGSRGDRPSLARASGPGDGLHPLSPLARRPARPGSRQRARGRAAPPPPCYRITAASFVRALHRGWSPQALLDALNGLADRPLTGQETARLRVWAQAAERVTIRRLTILESADPGVIERLASTRRGRSLIVRTLSPRAVVVAEARLDQLVRRLARQEGVLPLVQGGKGAGGRGRSGARAQGSKGAGEKSFLPPCPPAPLLLRPSAHIWLALKVYQGLGQFIRLPARTPQALLDYLASLADPDALASAEATAAMTLEALQEVVAGRAAFPPLVEPMAEGGLPVEESLAVIRAALAEGMALEMDYYTAGRDELTHRQVEPYRLEWRGASRGAEEQPALGSPGGGGGARGKGVPYLVGFCHRAQAERVFRVDRIHSVVKAPPAESERGLDGL